MGKIHFIWSGEAELPAGWALQPHSHDHYHLAYVQRGWLIFGADSLDLKRYPIRASLEYMRGLKDAAEKTEEVSRS